MSEVIVHPGQKRRNTAEIVTGNNNPNKMFKSDHVRVRILMAFNNKECYRVIGKGGENIKSLLKKYKVKVSGLTGQSNERAVTIEGDRGNCFSCLKDMLVHVAEGPYPSDADNRRKCPVELNLLLNTDTIASIVGKKGCQIKEICDKSKAKVKTYPENLPNSTERVVAIGAEKDEQVVTALDIVLDVLAKWPSKINTVYYDPENANNPNAAGMGMGVGEMGARAPGNAGYGNVQQVSNAHHPNAHPNAPYQNAPYQNAPYQNAPYQNAPYQNASMNNHYMNNASMNNHFMNNPQMENASIMPPFENSLPVQKVGVRTPDVDVGSILVRMRDNAKQQPFPQPDFQQLVTTTEITVPNEMCSSIIGSGGSNIRWAKEVSGAKIDFTQVPKYSKENRVVTIKGTQEQVQIAEQLMLQCARSR